MTDEFAAEIGADGFAKDAATAANVGRAYIEPWSLAVLLGLEPGSVGAVGTH